MTAPTAKLARSAAMASITVAVILVALKTWASWRTAGFEAGVDNGHIVRGSLDQGHSIQQ